MSRHESSVRLRHMLDHAREAVAMAAKVVGHLWSIQELIEMALEAETGLRESA